MKRKLPVKLERKYATHLTQEEEGAEVLEEPAKNFWNQCSAVAFKKNDRDDTEYINIYL